MSILVIAEHDNNSVKKSTLNTVTAAQALGNDIHILIVGSSCQAAVDQAKAVSLVNKVIVADADFLQHQLSEDVALIVKDLAVNYSHVLAPSTTTGKNLLPRVAALMDVQPLSDVIEIIDSDTFKRPIYAGNVIATVKMVDSVKLMTIRTTAFDACSGEGGLAEVENLSANAGANISTHVRDELSQSDKPELTSASIVISGGRGLQNGENFQLIYDLADKLGAAVGASRAAVDAGYVPNDMQVGQTGKIVAPDLYIAVGISGAIQHLAGMKDSKIIVAINKDEDAPIFQVADYGLVADLFEAVPALDNLL